MTTRPKVHYDSADLTGSVPEEGVFVLEGEILDIRDADDGGADIDIKKADGSVGTARLTKDQFAALELAMAEPN